jgi:hypothetical protein
VYLLGEERLRGLDKRLPDWLQRPYDNDDAKFWKLANGSTARAFPTTGGDSYTATFAIIDEADLVPDLSNLLGRVEPTVDAGGKLALISRVDKKRPNTRFKQIYKQAKAAETADDLQAEGSDWRRVFLPWYVHPGRTQAWYDRKKRDVLAQNGSLDELYEQYPASDVEALSGLSTDKRIPAKWLLQCYEELRPLRHEQLPASAPPVFNLHIYKPPRPGQIYTIGVDPAEGNPNSDDSAFTVGNVRTGEEVAHLSGKYDPEVLAGYVDMVGQWYNKANVMVERNNHGHTVLLWLRLNSPLTRLAGLDGKEGWLSSSLGKTRLYDGAASAFKNMETTLHSFKTYNQLGSIMGATLRAPEGEADDAADSYALMIAGIAHQVVMFAEVW